MAAKTLTIDGKQVSAEEGATILEVATDAGIKIPTLCHLDGVYDLGACRLCLVEVTGIAKLLPACTTKISEGMDVKTDSERLRKYRRMTLELLFAERNHICAVCVANGHCELQTLAYPPGHGPRALRLLLPRNGTWTRRTACSAWTTTAASFARRCVRVCWHIEGAGTKNVAGRGGKAKIITDLNQPWGDSETCTVLRQMRHVLPDRRAVSQRVNGCPKWNATATNSNSSSTHGRKNYGTA